MDKKISVSEESLGDIYKNIRGLIENLDLELNNIRKSFDLAEMEGWNDKKYHQLKNDFQESKYFFNEGSNYLEEVVIPEIKRIQNIIEAY